MISLKYEIKKEEFGEEELIEIVEITAETSYPNNRIQFQKNDQLLAETMTNNEGIAICGFSPINEDCTVKAIINEDEEEITVPGKEDDNED